VKVQVVQVYFQKFPKKCIGGGGQKPLPINPHGSRHDGNGSGCSGLKWPLTQSFKKKTRAKKKKFIETNPSNLNNLNLGGEEPEMLEKSSFWVNG
jgi:hypothetical protein